jgi:tetratricopeptide (TPR) repeat protein
MAVKIWSERVKIPTYGVGERDKNPMFLEKRVYQGSSGRVYPWPVIDKIDDEKRDREYQMVFLENEYIQVQVLPELGGRIYRALDKTNQYDFVYYNRVIKPALVGLTGPWISGGIEFNWPQHHRPNTFGPVEYSIDDRDPQKKTVWLSETDRMYGTRVTTGITVREGVAVIEISGELYNPTSEPQTFLWWANPAVAVHEETQSIFPPDVHAVMDHGKRDVSRFPIATGTYYKMDYSRGVDISRYKSIPVPTSYMAYHSDYDFVGGYDYRRQAGILHVADHHIAPGKKQWTWGSGEFGRAWDRNLTDEDGPYIELMTGVFTDNQPDFTWLQPYSGKNFIQHFMPYKAVGEVKCANEDIVAGLAAADGKAVIQLYSPKMLENVHVRLAKGGETIFTAAVRLSPAETYEQEVPVQAHEWELNLTVEADGAKPLRYAPEKPAPERVPEPAKAIGAPESLSNTEALLLAGLHLEQYRHATYEPELYYREGLKRDPGDLRLNNAYGNLLLRRGQFAEAQALFEAAKETATRHSPNPYDGEVFYNLGKALEYQGKEAAAFDTYYKATWSDAWRSQGFLKLARISARQGKLREALDHAKQSLWANYKNFGTRAAVTILNRLLDNRKAALKTAEETREFDPMDAVAARELALLTGEEAAGVRLRQLLRGDAHNAINLAVAYRELGQYGDAEQILRGHIQNGGEEYAMIRYFLAACMQARGDAGADAAWKEAAQADSDYCFPNRLEEYQILRQAAEQNPGDAKALYYLGCFLYDKKRYDDAKTAWEASAKLDSRFPTVHRNLALYYANKQRDYAAARRELEEAFACNREDARVFYELCELYKKIGLPFAEQRKAMEENRSLVEKRDDLSVSYAELLNQLGEYETAIELLTTRNFHPWEGGEGKVPTQHIEARLGMAHKLIAEGKYRQAIDHLEKASVYFPNFGEGKLTGAQENNLYYWMGLAYRHLDEKKARECFLKAAAGLSEPASALYYNDQPPHMIYYQGAALLELGREEEARSRFHKLIAYGEKQLFQKQVLDYFAVSLPDFLVFETDLDEKNQVHCYYMMGLGYMGLGQTEKALGAFDAALALAPGHYGVRRHKAQLSAPMRTL